MNLFKKVFVYSGLIILIFVIWGFVFLQKTRQDPQLRVDTIKIVKKIKDFVYYEATIHNPEGDMLPDQIDNTIISETKKILN